MNKTFSYSGQKRHRLVSILMKQTKLLVNLAKKCFGAVLTSRECKMQSRPKNDNFLAFLSKCTNCPVGLPSRTYQKKSFFSDAILEVMEKPHEAFGYYLLSLQTEGGYIKLLFQNEKQSFIWMSTISNFLKMQTAARDKYHNKL